MGRRHRMGIGQPNMHWNEPRLDTETRQSQKEDRPREKRREIRPRHDIEIHRSGSVSH